MSEFDALVQKLFEKLDNKSWQITTAESCTGGLIGAALTEVSGSSQYFDRGFVTYSNEAKMEMLGVLQQSLIKHGAVSEEVAKEMALGALENSNAQIAVSVTGVAGPGGGSDEKPVGLVYIGIATNKDVTAYKNNFDEDRNSVRRQTVKRALNLLLESL
jgi:nicotinamide-nucleotide amidase